MGGAGRPLTKIFFLAWTCIKPNLVSKIFPFTDGGGRGGPWQKFFFWPEHVSSQIWCQKFFPLLGGGRLPSTKIFFGSEHVSSQIWCQKFFPLLGEGGQGRGEGRGVPWQKIFFQSEHVSSKIWCQKFFPLPGGVGWALTKIFFPVWTCIKPNLVSKSFPFTESGYPPPPPNRHTPVKT